MIRKFGWIAVAAMAVATIGDVSAAEKKYGPGVTDTEIKLGQTVPYSGPASAFSSYGRVMTGYFKMVNEAGGINGRKVNLISLDNALALACFSARSEKTSTTIFAIPPRTSSHNSPTFLTWSAVNAWATSP